MRTYCIWKSLLLYRCANQSHLVYAFLPFRLLYQALGSWRLYCKSLNSWTRNSTRKSVQISVFTRGARSGYPWFISGYGFPSLVFHLLWWLGCTQESCIRCGSRVMKTVGTHFNNRYEVTNVLRIETSLYKSCTQIKYS